MTFVVTRCQTARPDLTLRYVNDGHPNQTMGYLTACTFYSVLFGKSPEGLTLNTVTDNRSKIPEHPEQDPDGGPRKVVFSDDLRLSLQSIAWNAVGEYSDIFETTENWNVEGTSGFSDRVEDRQ